MSNDFSLQQADKEIRHLLQRYRESKEIVHIGLDQRGVGRFRVLDIGSIFFHTEILDDKKEIVGVAHMPIVCIREIYSLAEDNKDRQFLENIYKNSPND